MSAATHATSIPIADGRLTEDWVEYDRRGPYRKVGAIPLDG